MDNQQRMLLIYDSVEDRDLIREAILKEISDIVIVDIQDESIFDQELTAGSFNLAVTDYKLDWSNGIKILQIIKDSFPDCPIIMFPQTGNEQIAVRAMKSGVYDYIHKSKSNLKRLALVVKKALEQREPISAILNIHAKYRSWFEGIPFGLFVLKPNGHILNVNNAAQETLGLKNTEEAQNFNFFENLITPENSKDLKSILDETGHADKFECSLILSGNKKIYVEINARTVLDYSGKEPQYEGSIQDITSRTEFENALKESENKFRKFTMAVDEVIYRYDPENNLYDFISPSIEKLSGYSLSELQKDPRGMLKKITHPEDQEKLFNPVYEHLKKGHSAGTFTRDYRILRKDNSVVWVSDHLTFEYDEKGELSRVNGVLQNITDKIKAQDALNQEKQFSENLLETAHAFIVVLEEKGKILRFNKYAEKMTGYSRDEVLGKNWFSIFVPDTDRDSVQKIHQDKIKMDSAYWASKGSIIKKDRSLLYISWQNSTLFNGRDNQRIVLAIGIDQTIWQTVEKEKENIRSQLYQAQKMEAIGILAGGIAHDFNNMLTSILGYSDMAMIGLDPVIPLYSDLNRIRELTMKAGDLVRKLLLFSRKQPMNFQVLNINSTIQNLSDMLNRLLGPSIHVKTKLDKETLSVEADRGNIEQVLMNLAVNAKDAMENGGTLTIATRSVDLNEKDTNEISGSRPGKFIKISVIDSGVGIEESALKNIFEPFYSTKGVGEGTGLGLSVVYGIISQHQGWINVSSQKNKGTQFDIFLPTTTEKVKSPPTVTTIKSGLQGKGEKILVIEDEEDVRKYASKALRKHGYSVYPATNGHDALDKFIKEGGNFDLVFCDVVLPDCKGPDLIKDFKNIRKGFKVLFSSGYPNFRDNDEQKKILKYDFLPKPYSLISLLRAIQNCLK